MAFQESRVAEWHFTVTELSKDVGRVLAGEEDVSAIIKPALLKLELPHENILNIL